MTADLLRRAATKIRETAENATPGPWTRDRTYPFGPGGGYSISVRSPQVTVSAGLTKRDAVHIALWSPDVALLVADMLDDAAENAELLAPGGDLGPGYSNVMVRFALDKATDLARRILGEDA